MMPNSKGAGQTSPLNVQRIGGVTMAENPVSTRPPLARKPHRYKVDEGLDVRFLCHANSTHVLQTLWRGLAKGLGYLRHGWLVSGKIYLSPDPAVRVLKGYGGEGPYVLHGHLLERLVRVEWLSQSAPKDHPAHHLPVLHQKYRAQDRVAEVEFAHMVLDFPLALEVR